MEKGLKNRMSYISSFRPSSVSSQSNEMVEAWSYVDMNKLYNRFPSGISSFLKTLYGVIAIPSSIDMKITLMGQLNQVQGAIVEIKRCDLNAHFYYVDRPSISTKSTSSFNISKEFRGDDVDKILFFCKDVLEAGERNSIFKKEISRNPELFLKLYAVASDPTEFYKNYYKIWDIILDLKVAYVYDIPLKNFKIADDVTKKMKPESECLAIFKSDRGTMYLFSKSQKKLEECQKKLDVELKQKTGSTTEKGAQFPVSSDKEVIPQNAGNSYQNRSPTQKSGSSTKRTGSSTQRTGSSTQKPQSSTQKPGSSTQKPGSFTQKNGSYTEGDFLTISYPKPGSSTQMPGRFVQKTGSYTQSDSLTISYPDYTKHKAQSQNSSDITSGSQRKAYSKFYSEFYTKKGLHVKLYCSSITTLKVGAIISAANEQLQNYAGVAGAIAVAAGSRLDGECLYKLQYKGGFLNVTEILTTSGYNLPTGYVIHAVGPRWDDYTDKRKCLRDLCKTVKNALITADGLVVESVAMPAISSGIFGVPQDLCAEAYVYSIMELNDKNALSQLKEVHIVDITDTVLLKIENAYKMWKQDPNSINPKNAIHNHPSLMQDTRHSYIRGGLTDEEMNDVNHSTDRVGQKTETVKAATPDIVKIVETQDSRINGTSIKVSNFEVGGLMKLKIYTGSIVRVKEIDAIVCSADRGLTGVGFLSSAIATAGGQKYKDSFFKMQKKYTTRNRPMDVYTCDPGDIRVKYVVHVVIDQMSRTDQNTCQTFKQTIINLLEKTNGWGMKAIALPLIGAGFIEKDPKDLAAVCKSLLGAICEFCHQKGKACNLIELSLVNKNSIITDTLVNAFKKHATVKSARAKSASVSSQHFETTSSMHSLSDKIPDQHQHKHSVSDHSARRGAKIKYPYLSKTYGPGSHQQMEPMEAEVSDQALQDEYNTRSGRKEKPRGNDWRGARPKYSDYRKTYGPGSHQEIEPMEAEDSDMIYARTLQDEENAKLGKKGRERGNVNILGNDDFVDSSLDNCSGKYDTGLEKSLEFSMKDNHSSEAETNSKCDSCNSSGNESLSCGHTFCNICFIPMLGNRVCILCSASEETNNFKSEESQEKENKMDCVICMDKIKNGKKLKCGHEFCENCISDAFKHKPACPMCGSIFGKVLGNQPNNGEMKVHTENVPALPGFDRYGTIVIKYVFPDGIQKENHPNPGKKYKGTERTAYLPDNPEGRKILKMLKVAWDRKLIFTIGSSRTTGQENVVTWNDIHHKTKRYHGAEFGFPDAGYFDRVTDELAAKGVTENDI